MYITKEKGGAECPVAEALGDSTVQVVHASREPVFWMVSVVAVISSLLQLLFVYKLVWTTELLVDLVGYLFPNLTNKIQLPMTRLIIQ